MKRENFEDYILYYTDTVNSTNSWLQSQNFDSDRLKVVLVADYQTSGKGVGNHTWHSEKGKNLLFSIGINAEMILPAEQFLLTQIIALAIVEVLEKLINLPGISIKWPNDLYFNDKKMGGILISNTIRASKLDQSIIGVGLNINQMSFPDWIPRPVSLQQITGHEFNSIDILKSILHNFAKRFEQTNDSRGRDLLKQDYHNKLYRLGSWNNYEIDGKIYELKIEGVGDYGLLMLTNRHGETISCDFKSIRFVQ